MQSRSNSRVEKSSLTITARREEKQHISSTEAGHKDPLFVGETPLRKNNHQEEKICRMQFQDSQQRNETFLAIETSSSSSQGSSECFIPEEENGCSRIVEIGNQREPQTCSDAPITEQQNFYKDVMNELMKLRQELETERGMRRKLENKISRQSKKIKELKVKTPSQEDTLKTPPIQLKIEAVTTLDDSNSSNACSPPNYSGDDAEEIKPELCDESPTEDAALSPNGLNLQKSTLNSQTNMNTIQTPVTDYERMQSSGRQGCKEKSLTKHNLPAFDDSASHAKNKDNGSRKRKISEKQLRTSSGSNLKKLKNSSEIGAFSSSSLITSREGVNGGILDSEIQLQPQTESTACTEEVEIVDKRTGFILKGIECISEMSKCDSNPPDVNCTKEDGVLSTMSSRIRSITSECKTKNNNKSSLDYSYGCNLCGLKFCSMESLQCHVPCVGSVANKDPLKCGVCSKTFRECVDLERHLQGLCSNEHFECEVCSKNCASKLCLAWHMQMHVDVEPENRANQSKTFLTKESQASQRSSECTICNKRFFSKLCLQSHMKQHKGNEVELLSGVSDDCQLENLVIPEESSDCQEPVNSSFYATLDINKSLTAHLISKDAELQEQNSTRHCDRERSLWSLFDQDTLFRDSGSNLPTDLNQKKTNHQQNLSSVGIFECMSSKIAPGQKQTTELICAQEISSEITKTYRPYCVKCWNTFKDLKAMEEHARFCNESCHDSNTRAMIPSNISECIIIKSEDRPRSSERVLENGSKEITLKRFGAVVGNGSVDVAKSNTFEELRIGSDTRDISNLHVSVEEKAMNGLDQVPHCESHDWPKNSLYGLPRREPNDLASMLYVLSKNAANDLANSESDDLAESFSEQVANIESYLANSESGLLDMNGSDKVANEKSDDVVKNGSDESGEDMSREVTKIFLGKVTKSRPSELISCGSDEFLTSHFIDSAKSGSQKLTKNVLHEESNCTSDNALHCLNCQKIFSSRHKLNKHMELHKVFGSSLRCNHCKHKFTLLDSLQEHTCQAYTIEGPQFRCPDCEESFEISLHLKNHMGKVHSVEQPFKCKRCGKQYEKFCQWNQHVQGHRTDRHYVCNKCGCRYKFLHHLKREHLPCLSNSTKLKCPKCNQKFMKASRLRLHVALCQNERAAKCRVCYQLFAKQSKLDKHMCRHIDERPYQCPQCDKCFIFHEDLIRHVHRHSIEKSYICVVCNKAFMGKASLLSHLKIHTTSRKTCSSGSKINGMSSEVQVNTKERQMPKGLYGCGLCGCLYITMISLRHHLPCEGGAGEKDPFFCGECNKKFCEENELEKHVASKTKKPFPCRHCSKCFLHSSSLKRHLETVHLGSLKYAAENKNLHNKCQSDANLKSQKSLSTAGTDDALYCMNCCKTFSSHEQLNKHLELRTCMAYSVVGPQFRCPECEESFKIRWQFKNHMSKVHSIEQNFKCKHCGKQYDNFSLWNKHVQAHRTDRCYVCNKCGKGFKHLRNLKDDHLPCLTDSAELKCPKCNYVFERASELRRHVRLCQNERAVNCRVCHRLFHSQLGLDRHKCCLTGENPYQCPQCGKCFSCRKGLVSHTHNHSTEKPYVCDVCGKAFAVRRAFLEHSKIHVNAKEKCGLGINITGVSNQVEKKKKRKQLENRFYGCGLCGCLYLSMISLKQHLPCEEGGTGEKGPFFCGGCNKTFCEENELEKHVISVHSENLFSCSVCNKMFARKLSLKLHMQSHTGERPFKCKRCDETFKLRAHLKYHLPCYASPGSDIRCDQCQMTFDKITKLRTHVSINHSSSAVQCEVCGKKLSSRSGLDIHLKSHANKSKEERQKPYSCRRCSKCFVHSSSLMRHLETAHLEPLKCGSENKNPDSKYQYDITLKSDILPIISGTDDILYCPSCHKTFSSQHLLNKHLELHKKFGSSLSCSHCKQKFTLLDSIQGHTCQAYSIEGPQFRCPECEESFEISQPLKKHMSEVHSVEQPFKCKRCGKQYEKFCQWNSHVQDHRTDRHYVCNKCGKKYKYLHHLKCDHLPCLSESAELKCPKCNEEFRKATQLRTHVTLCQNVRAVKCQVCQRLFHNQKKLDKHMCCHMREKPYQCPQCDKCFSSCKYLMYHVQCHSDSKPYVCDVCGKGFEAEAFLQKHSNIHMSDPPYKCNECDMSFIYACHLRDHKEKVHGGVKKRFACGICNKSFFSKSYLNAHMCSHTGQNPHLCSVCGKGFPAKMLLKYHLRVHTGEKPYACKYCYRRFSMPRSMRNHERVHTGEKPYECTICGMKFPQSSYLKNHSKKAHMAA